MFKVGQLVKVININEDNFEPENALGRVGTVIEVSEDDPDFNTTVYNVRFSSSVWVNAPRSPDQDKAWFCESSLSLYADPDQDKAWFCESSLSLYADPELEAALDVQGWCVGDVINVPQVTYPEFPDGTVVTDSDGAWFEYRVDLWETFGSSEPYENSELSWPVTVRYVPE